LSFSLRRISFQREAPEHTLFVLVKLMLCGRDAPMTHVLPATHAEFIKERDAVARLDGGKERAIRRC
jgi:hypothetical protein